MTGFKGPYHQEGQGSWDAADGQQGWPQAGQTQPPIQYPEYEYPLDYNGQWPLSGPFDGIPQEYAVPPVYPGIPGQIPQTAPKKSKPWILIASIAGALVVALTAGVVLMLSSRESTPRQTAAAPSASPTAQLPELPTAPAMPSAPQRPPAAAPAPTGAPAPLPSPGSAPKAPGQVLAVGDCVAVSPPSDYKPLPCADPKAVFKVFDLHDGGVKCKSAQVGFTAGEFSYCLVPQLQNGSCYKSDKVMGATVFVAVDSCGDQGAFRVMMQFPGTTEHQLCDFKPGVRRFFTVADPPMVICAS